MATTPPPTDPGNTTPAQGNLPGTDPVITLDLIGSTQTLGVASRRLDRAVRRGIATGIGGTGTNQQLGLAINRAIEVAQLHHHWMTDLPLQSVRATKFGKDQAWLSLQYGRPQATSPPSRSPSQVAQFRTAYEHTQAYRDTTLYDGVTLVPFAHELPQGDMHGLVKDLLNPTDPERNTYQDPGHEPSGYRFRRPVIRIIATVYTFVNPYPSCAAAVNKVNPLGVLLGGYSIEAGELRFDGLDVDWVERSDGADAFICEYHFTASPGGHWKQEPKFVQGEWTAFDVPSYQTWSGVTFEGL